MRAFFSGLFSAVVFLSLAFAMAQTHENVPLSSGLRKRHFGRPRSPLSNADFKGVPSHTTVSLQGRYEGSRFSFYDAGMGACGKTNSAADFIVALNQAQWDGGSHCFETITITYNGKSTQAQVTDMCPGCSFGELDFSRGLFNYFASEDAGLIYGTWGFGSGAAEKPKTTSQEPKTTKAPKTSSTAAPPPPMTTETPTSTTTSHTSSSTSTSQVTSSTAQTSSTSSAPTSTTESQASVSATKNSAPSITPSTQPTGSLQEFNLAYFQLAKLISAGASR